MISYFKQKWNKKNENKRRKQEELDELFSLNEAYPYYEYLYQLTEEILRDERPFPDVSDDNIVYKNAHYLVTKPANNLLVAIAFSPDDIIFEKLSHSLTTYIMYEDKWIPADLSKTTLMKKILLNLELLSKRNFPPQDDTLILLQKNAQRNKIRGQLK